MRFLIVDDSPVIRLVLQRILVSYGTCDLAKDGTEALEAHALSLSEGRPFDLVCLDIGLPGIQGSEVLARLRELEAKTPGSVRTRVIVITASTELGDVEAFHKQGADGYVVKPVNKDKLIEYLKNFGLLGGPAEKSHEKRIEEVEAMCAADELPMAVLAKLISSMAGSIGRQSSGRTASPEA